MSDGTVMCQFDDIAESVAFSPDGKLLASGSGTSDPKIRLRTVEDWTLVNTLNSSANSIAFSPDGASLASNDSYSIKLWGIHK